MSLRRAFLALRVPGAMVLLGTWLAYAPGAAALRGASWLAEAPYLVLALVALGTLRFHRANLVYVCLVLAGACASLQHLAPEAPRIVPLLAFLVPLNLLVLAADSPPPLWSGAGLLRPGILAVQAAVLVGLAHPALWMEYTGGLEPPPVDLTVSLARSLLPEGWPALRPTFLAWGLVTMLATWRLLRKPEPIQAGILAALLATAAGLANREALPACCWQFCGAGAALAAALMQHSYNLAYLDELTGLPGRRALKEEMAHLRGRYVLAMLDVDHFKNFNDTYGHDVGDQVLRLVASRMRKAAGPGRPFRYGGEEFTMLFQGKDLPEVLDVLDGVRLAVEQTPMVLRGPDRPQRKPTQAATGRGSRQKVTITISIGAAAPDSRSRRPEEVLKAADKALYRAKEQGRNRVCAAGQATSPRRRSAAPTAAG